MRFPPSIPGLVTVIVPFFNRERLLGETIASILRQSHRKIQLLLVDDGSTDRSLQVAGSFPDPRIRLLRSSRRSGKPAAVNRALPLSRGEWLTIFDSDDLMTPASLERRVRFLKRHPSAPAVMGRIGRVINGRGRPLPPVHPVCRQHRAALWVARRFCGPLGGLPPELFVYGRCPVSPLSATLFRRSAVRRIGRLRALPPWEDRDYLLRLALRRPVPFLDFPALHYRVHDGNLSFRIAGQRTRLPGERRLLEQLEARYRRERSQRR